ncbi:nucleotidyltransferase family protein [Eubacterium ventriosum]|uniref:nucleotidyltransferase family protein n=1 Tax=Eubacterium ventriosum TaxID=39496 RepID=UPI00351FFFE3
MKGLILACGSGSRLAPFTDNSSKALVPYMNHNALYYQCRTFKKWNISEITIFYDKGDEADFFESVKDLDVKLEAFHLKRGWDNTWKKAAELFKNDTVVIVNCDIILPFEYGEVIKKHFDTNSALSLACNGSDFIQYGQLAQLLYIRENENGVYYHSSNYTLNANVVREVGMSVVSGCVWNLVGDMSFESVDPWRDSLIPLAIERRLRVQCVRVNVTCQDIGTWKGLQTAYLYPIVESSGLINKVGSNLIEEGALVENEKGLENVIVMKNSIIKKDVVIKDAFVLPESVIEYSNDKKIIYIGEVKND